MKTDSTNSAVLRDGSDGKRGSRRFHALRMSVGAMRTIKFLALVLWFAAGASEAPAYEPALIRGPKGTTVRLTNYCEC